MVLLDDIEKEILEGKCKLEWSFFGGEASKK